MTPTQMFLRTAILRSPMFLIIPLFKNTYFKEHLHTAASKVTLRSDYLGLFPTESLSNPSWLSYITKIPVTFR